jgi:hypothetical protein
LWGAGVALLMGRFVMKVMPANPGATVSGLAAAVIVAVFAFVFRTGSPSVVVLLVMLGFDLTVLQEADRNHVPCGIGGEMRERDGSGK